VTNLILILGIAVILLSASISQSAFADGTIDQNNLGKQLDGLASLSPVPPELRFAQIFTPIAESLDAVEIEIQAPSLTGTKQEITVKVHQGNSFGVPFVSSVGFANLPEVCHPSCVIHIDLPAPILLKPGLPHILEIILKNTGMKWFFADANDPYPGGDVITKQLVSPFNSVVTPTVDLIFATLQDLSVTEIIVVVTDVIGVLDTATIFVQCEVDTAPFEIDHYLGYAAKTAKKTPKFDKVTVELSDQFGSGIFEVEKTTRLYNPVQKTKDGCEFPINDKVTHLKAYKIKEAQNNVLVKNQFGELIVTTSKAELLLVPTAKSHDVPNVPELASTPVDHYKCYKVKIDKNAPLQFEPLQVTLFDPNFNADKKVFDVIKPKWLCNPVDKNGEGIMNPADHLMCYSVEPAEGFMKNKKRSVFTHNQFGPEQLDVKKEKELCVPSEKTLLE